MSRESDLALMLDEWAMKRLAYNYARGGDRNDPELFASVFTEDAIVISPQATIEGRANLAKIPQMLNSMFSTTLHTVLNQTVTIDGDKAEGETYCIAYHMNHPIDGKQTRFDMYIRYQDQYRREAGQWRFTKRHLLVDWTETVDVKPAGA